MKGFRKVLVAVNGSQAPLETGIKLAREEKAWLTVVKVVPPFEGDLDLTGIKNIGDALDSGGSRAVEDIKETAAREPALVKARLEEGETHERIIEVAKEERCDLIIMGAERMGILKRLFLGSTLEKVLRDAPCPVLVV